MKILKIGGSLITEKREGVFEVAKEKEMERIAKILKGVRDIIIVHGVGSFGHPHVKKYGISDAMSITKVHNACLRLDIMFCSYLEKYDVSVFPIHPIEFFPNPDLKMVEKLLEFGFVPVFHGDVIMEGEKFRVISGDEIVRMLAEYFKPEKVGFASDSEILHRGEVVEVVNERNYQEILKDLKGAVGKDDVTGGMLNKYQEALRIAKHCETYIFNSKNLEKFMKNEIVPTKIEKGNYKL
ncbi:isopentenyl phosphate kinase [Ferroglobus sp.]|uniref:isopentenyl phosphate kinase n=1 Tax=Ferroglobus sp. TaxID=2614230 RepID=UPI0025C178E5|nr:isopentenyl phosphate kinase [Ferroglobus sp.]